MVSVLGPIELLQRNIEDVVGEYNLINNEILGVVINADSSVQKIIQKDLSLPREVREYSAKEQEIVVQKQKSVLGMKQYKTIIALTYPYNSRCIIVADERYSNLGVKVREKISEVERDAIDLWFM